VQAQEDRARIEPSVDLHWIVMLRRRVEILALAARRNEFSDHNQERGRHHYESKALDHSRQHARSLGFAASGGMQQERKYRTIE
jgi:hypothetical protein